MIKQFIILIGMFLVFSFTGNAQRKVSEHILKLDTLTTSPKAKIVDVAWIAGEWKGKAFGGITEENWSKPSGDSMMAAFKLTVDNKVKFYEIEVIREVKESLILQLKHFNGDLKGWESKDETVDFPLVKITEKAVYFDGMTFEKISDNEMNVYVLMTDDHKHKTEMKFNYKK